MQLVLRGRPIINMTRYTWIEVHKIKLDGDLFKLPAKWFACAVIKVEIYTASCLRFGIIYIILMIAYFRKEVGQGRSKFINSMIYVEEGTYSDITSLQPSSTLAIGLICYDIYLAFMLHMNWHWIPDVIDPKPNPSTRVFRIRPQPSDSIVGVGANLVFKINFETLAGLSDWIKVSLYPNLSIQHPTKK